MRVHMVDPSAFTAPYDHALCTALARAGAEVELVTSRFVHGSAPAAEGYAMRERFYRLAPGRPGSTARRAAKLAQHVPDLLGYRASGRMADIVHVQWLAAPALDAAVLPRGRALVYTAHNALREGAGRGERRMYRRADAIVVHSEAARDRLAAEEGLERVRVHVIAHGAFDYLTRLPAEQALPDELAAVRGPVALCFGLLRPYKGIDVLLEAWRGMGPKSGELWIVGAPRMNIEALRASSPSRVRWVPRFLPDSALPAYFRRADLVVLPHRRVDQSGAAFAALAFGRPLLLTDVGGFRDLARAGAATLVPVEDPDALRAELARLLEDPAARERLARGARAAAAGPYAWTRIGEQTLGLYRSLMA